jgi:hypothetical protein
MVGESNQLDVGFGKEGSSHMSNLLIGLAAVQKAAGPAKFADRRHRVLAIVGGIVLALSIAGGLLFLMALGT